MPRRALIFDLDDTLYPEYQYVCSGLRAVSRFLDSVRGLNQAATFDELVEIFDSGVRRSVLSDWLERKNMERGPLLQEMIRVYREHEPEITLPEGMAEMLKSLRGPFALGILSDGIALTQRLKIRALGLEAMFDTVILTDELGFAAAKPSPLGFLEALQRLSCAPRFAAYIADNPLKDFAGPRGLGMKTVRLIRAEGIYANENPPCADYEADETIYDIRGLLEVIPRLLPGPAGTSALQLYSEKRT